MEKAQKIFGGNIPAAEVNFDVVAVQIQGVVCIIEYSST